MSQSARVSVVLTTHNCAERVRETVQNIASQTLESKQIIVVDDASTDGTGTILDEIRDEFRIKVIRNAENRGAGHARNRGLTEATGEYVIFLDDDDLFDPEMLAVAHRRATETDADMVVMGSRGLVSNTGETFGLDFAIRTDLLPEATVFAPRDVARDIFHVFTWWPWDKLIRRRLVVDAGLQFQSLRHTNDLLFVCTAFLAAERVCVEPRILITHVMARSGSVSSRRAESPTEAIVALRALLQHLLDHGLADRRMADYRIYVACFLHWHQSTLPDPARYILCKAALDYFREILLTIDDVSQEAGLREYLEIHRFAGLPAILQQLETAQRALAQTQQSGHPARELRYVEGLLALAKAMMGEVPHEAGAPDVRQMAATLDEETPGGESGNARGPAAFVSDPEPHGVADEVDAGFIDSPPLSVAMLDGTFWRIGGEDGRIVSPFMVLAPGGLVGNCNSPSADMWQIVNGLLSLVGENGEPSITFTMVRMEGDRMDMFAGRGVVDGIQGIYLLQSVDHPDHPLYASPRETPRKASFLKVLEGERRANLVVLPAGPGSLHPFWLEGEGDTPRNWDLCLGWYGADRPDPSIPCEYLAHIPRTKKFRLLYDLLHEDSPLWNYDAIWLPDDDLLASTAGINVMFHLFRRFGLDLAQPSLMQGPNCYPNHPITVRRPNSDVRYEPFVEIMCPILSRRALKICVGSMRDVESGYGLDHLWPSLLGYPRERIGMIDAIAVVHTRPIGATYDIQRAVDEQAAVHRVYDHRIRQIPGVW